VLIRSRLPIAKIDEIPGDGNGNNVPVRGTRVSRH
jgi:hypothetical protein